jgi:hypothetical protein
MWVQLAVEIDEDQHRGDPFESSLVGPVVDQHGGTLVPAGTVVRGRIVDVNSATIDRPAAVELAVVSMELEGQVIPLAGHVVNTEVPGHGPSKAKGAIAGAAAGAIVGGILRGGTGALVGGLVGAGGGTLIAAGMGRHPELPPGTRLAVQIDQPVASLASLRRRIY